MPLDFANDSRGSFRKAFFLIVALLIIVGWIPIIGPLIAGIVGGRAARKPATALLASILPAVVFAFAVHIVTQGEITINHQTVSLGPLYLFIPVGVACLIGGALLGAFSGASRALGLLVVLTSLGWLGLQIKDIVNLYHQVVGSSQSAATPEQNKTCPDHLAKLYSALKLYASSWDDTLPPADRWVTALRDPTQPFAEEDMVHCPVVSNGKDQKYGYAMNAALGGKRLRDIKDAAKTPLLYDSSDLKKDAHDNVTSLPKPGRHDGKNNVLNADGSVTQR